MKRTFSTFIIITIVIIVAAFAFACGGAKETEKRSATTGSASINTPKMAGTPAANSSSPVAGTVNPISGGKGEAKSASSEVKTEIKSESK